MAKRPDEFRYEAVDRAGEGTLFVVYKARDKAVNKPVALKVLRQRFARDRALVEKIQHSLQTTVDLPHAHIARVFSVGEEDGHLFVATEFLTGELLEDKIHRDAPLARRDALSLLIQICEAVYHAHQNGVVHGDLRPRNIFVTPDGKIKVTDFAIANAFAHTKVRLPELLADAARYCAPEVAEGAPASALSDLYSLGVIAYKMLTATVPFDGKSANQILSQHICRNPPLPSNFNPSLAPAIEDVLLKLLRKEPRDRYTSAGELLKVLREIEGGMEPGRAMADWSAASLQQARRTSAREKLDMPPSCEEPNGVRNIAWNVTLFTVLVLIVSAFLFWIGTSPKEVVVPDVRGKPVSEATTMLRSMDLTFVEARRQCDDIIPEGCVIATMPPAGRRVKEGRAINAIVSRGREQTIVPNVREMPLDEAQAALRQAGMTVGDIQEIYHPLIAKGLVVAQIPEPDERVAKNTRASLQVSRGPEPEIPPAGASARKREIDVSIDVPHGPTQQEIRIEVRDGAGTRTAYERPHSPGDHVGRRITVIGEKALIRVYVAGRVAEERVL